MENCQKNINVQHISEIMSDTELEELDLTDDSAEDDAFNYPGLCNFGGETETEPGLLIGAELEERQDVVCEEGVLKIPKGKVLNTIQPGAAWGIEDGVITVGYAHNTQLKKNSGGGDGEEGGEGGTQSRERETNGETNGENIIPGVLKSCEIRKVTSDDTGGNEPVTTSQSPVINQGNLILPLCQAGEYTGKSDPNSYSPGMVAGFEVVGGGACCSITDGVLRINLSDFCTTNNLESSLPIFDEEWFTVKENTVSLKKEALQNVVDELVNEMSVEVTATGLLEKTEYGDLKANTAGNLSLQTNVSY
jgi:hypothetical protein